MALKLTQKQTPEMLGIRPEQVQALTAAGGRVELPNASRYIRLAGIHFPRARHIALVWEDWPNKETAAERTGPHGREEWLICPEPNVLRREVQALSGEILEPALVLPTYDDFVGKLAEMKSEKVEGKGVKLPVVADAIDAVRKAAYALANGWPAWKGATVE